MDPALSWKPFKVEAKRARSWKSLLCWLWRWKKVLWAKAYRQPPCTRNTRGQILPGTSVDILLTSGQISGLSSVEGEDKLVLLQANHFLVICYNSNNFLCSWYSWYVCEVYSLWTYRGPRTVSKVFLKTLCLIHLRQGLLFFKILFIFYIAITAPFPVLPSQSPSPVPLLLLLWGGCWCPYTSIGSTAWLL